MYLDWFFAHSLGILAFTHCLEMLVEEEIPAVLLNFKFVICAHCICGIERLSRGKLVGIRKLEGMI